jgi:hypothetical protein
MFDLDFGMPIENTGVKVFGWDMHDPNQCIRVQNAAGKVIRMYHRSYKREGPRTFDVIAPDDTIYSQHQVAVGESTSSSSSTTGAVADDLTSSMSSSSAGAAADDNDYVYQHPNDDVEVLMEPESYQNIPQPPLTGSSARNNFMPPDRAAVVFSMLCQNHEVNSDGTVCLHSTPIDDKAVWAYISPMKSGSSDDKIVPGAQFATCIILSSTIKLRDGETVEQKKFDDLYKIVYDFYDCIIRSTEDQVDNPDDWFLDPQTLVTYEVVTALSFPELISLVDAKAVNALRDLKFDVPFDASLSLSCLLCEDYDIPPNRHFSSDRAAAAKHFFYRILRYEKNLSLARDTTLFGIPFSDELPVGATKGYYNVIEKHDFAPGHLRLRGIIGFEKNVFDQLMADLEDCTTKYYLGRLMYRTKKRPMSVVIGPASSDSTVYVKLRNGSQLFEVIRIHYMTPAHRSLKDVHSSHTSSSAQLPTSTFGVPTISSLENRYPATLILEKYYAQRHVTGKVERKLPRDLEFENYTGTNTHILGLSGHLITTSYWSAYRHSDFKELKHMFHDDSTADALKTLRVVQTALDNKNKPVINTDGEEKASKKQKT